MCGCLGFGLRKLESTRLARPMGRRLEQFIGVFQAEFHFDSFPVKLDGFDAQAKLAGDLASAFPFSQEPENLTLAVAELLQRRGEAILLAVHLLAKNLERDGSTEINPSLQELANG